MIFSDNAKIIGRGRFSNKVPAGGDCRKNVEDHCCSSCYHINCVHVKVLPRQSFKFFLPQIKSELFQLKVFPLIVSQLPA